MYPYSGHQATRPPDRPLRVAVMTHNGCMTWPPAAVRAGEGPRFNVATMATMATMAEIPLRGEIEYILGFELAGCRILSPRRRGAPGRRGPGGLPRRRVGVSLDVATDGELPAGRTGTSTIGESWPLVLREPSIRRWHSRKPLGKTCQAS